MVTENIAFFTKPGEWVRADRAPRTIAFDHVVGLMVGDTVLWEDSRHQPQELQYSSTDTELREFSIEQNMAARVMSFFTRHRARPVRGEDTYNCHSFASWVRGDIPLVKYYQEVNQLEDADKPIPEKLAYNKSIPVGSHVVVGARDREAAPVGIVPAHSAIDLGGELLAVMGINGPLALDTPDATLQHYNERYCASGLYAPRTYCRLRRP